MTIASNFPLYFAVISLTMTVLLFWLNHRLNHKVFQLDRTEKYKRKIAFDLALVLMVSGFIGGRVLHIVFEEWFYYMVYPQEIFKFWKGGFVYYGGWIACFISGWWFLKTKNQKLLPWADFFTPLFSLGYALGRVACYLEGCCYGTTRIPLQLIMVFCELLLLGAVLLIEKRQLFKKAGTLFLTWLLVHATTRFIVEFYRSDERGHMVFDILSVSQVISLLLVILAVMWIMRSKKYS